MSRKNAFSYIMWFVYSMAVCVSLFAIAGSLCGQAGYTNLIGYGIVAAWLVLGGLMVFLVHKLTSRFSGIREKGKIPVLVAESLAVVILFALGIFLRLQGLSEAGEDAAYYEMAKVAEGQGIPAIVHGATYIYLQLLHLVYFLFGNIFITGIWLQIGLQALAAFCLYRGVRKKAGIIASLVTFGFVMVGPVMVEESLALSPEIFLLAVFGIVFYFCCQCICGSKHPVMALLVGLLIAAVCYLDISGVVLLVLTVVGLLQQNSEEERSLKGRVLSTLLCVISSGLGFVLLILLDSIASGKAFGNVILAWWELYVPSEFLLPEYLQVSSFRLDVVCLIFIMSLGIAGFWCNRLKECQSLWVLSTLLLIVMQCFGMTTAETNGFVILYIMFAVLAGISIANMFGVVEEGNILKALDMIVRKEEQETETLKEEKVEAKAPDAEEMKVKYLENPLPLPKKHEKKTLDYDYDVIAGQDDYDIAVDDNDDFDI